MENFAISCYGFQLPYIIGKMTKADLSGLAWSSFDEEKEPQFIGTNKEWETYEQENLNAYYDDNQLKNSNENNCF